MDDRMQAEIALAAAREQTPTEPNVPYVKYLMMDGEEVPLNVPPELAKGIYDRELSLAFLDEKKQTWLIGQHMRGENLFKQGRPALSNNHRDEITFALMQAKLMIKLSRSSISSKYPNNERILQAMQIVNKQVTTSGGSPQMKKSRWSILGFGKKKEETPP